MRKTAGFTIFELMVALAIVGTLVSIAVPTYKKFINKTRTTEATTFLSVTGTAEKSFYMSEGSYTACIAKIMSPSDGSSLYFSIGFSQFTSTPKTCGKNSNSSCYQLCYTSKCSMSCSPGVNSTFFMANNYDNSVGSSNITSLYNLATSSLYTDWSLITSQDFLIIAAAEDTLVAENSFTDRLFPEANAAKTVSPKVYGIDTQGVIHPLRTDFSGCCSDHGGIDRCHVGGVMYCNDGTPSPSCRCY